jgi:pyrroline-5-carboxylate reductase
VRGPDAGACVTGYNSTVETPQIALIGGGNMGRALVGGLLQRGAPVESIQVGEADARSRAALQREFGVRAHADNAAAASGAGVLVIAVKPPDVTAVLGAITPQLEAHRPLVISVAAGIRLQALAAACPRGAQIVRAMPNRAALVGAGITGLYAPASVQASQRELAENVLRAVGTVVWLAAEGDLDTVTALSGSGPAYFFLLAEAMMQAAVKLGLDPLAARTLAVETLHGAGCLAHASDGDLMRLRAEVTSKGGTTEAALRVLEAEGLRGSIERALAAAAQRSRELAAQFGSESR